MKKLAREQEQRLTKLQEINLNLFEELNHFFSVDIDNEDRSNIREYIATAENAFNQVFPDETSAPEGLIKVTDVKFIHIIDACMSFGLYVDEAGNGFTCSSAAARVGSPTDFDKKGNGRHIDTYSRKVSRGLIVDRLNHHFGNLEQRDYTLCKVCPIGKVTNTVAMHKKMIEVINELLLSGSEINRKEFVLASLGLINETLTGELDPSNSVLVKDAVAEIYTEFTALKELERKTKLAEEQANKLVSV